ncbi:Uncharacterized protein FWK35_00021428, partial [Aphis craccivora]
MIIIVNKKFTSNRSGRTHYGNDGSMPSILSAVTVAAIAYFALPRTHPTLLPSKTAVAVVKRSFPLCTLKCRLQITIFNEVADTPPPSLRPPALDAHPSVAVAGAATVLLSLKKQEKRKSITKAGWMRCS